MERANQDDGFSSGDTDEVVATVDGTKSSLDLEVPLFARTEATYLLEGCIEDGGCHEISGAQVAVGSPADLTPSIGQLDAGVHLDAGSNFGTVVDLSGDGQTLAIGAPDDNANGATT